MKHNHEFPILGNITILCLWKQYETHEFPIKYYSRKHQVDMIVVGNPVKFHKRKFHTEFPATFLIRKDQETCYFS